MRWGASKYLEAFDLAVGRGFPKGWSHTTGSEDFFAQDDFPPEDKGRGRSNVRGRICGAGTGLAAKREIERGAGDIPWQEIALPSATP